MPPGSPSDRRRAASSRKGPSFHLVRAGERELGFLKEQHAPRNLVARKALGDEGTHPAFFQGGPRFRDDAGDHHLAQGVVRDADGRPDLHSRTIGEHRVDLGRRHIGAAGLDDVVQASLPMEPALRVDESPIAGPEKAFGVEHIFRRDPQVPEHQGGPLTAISPASSRGSTRPDIGSMIRMVLPGNGSHGCPRRSPRACRSGARSRA